MPLGNILSCNLTQQHVEALELGLCTGIKVPVTFYVRQQLLQLLGLCPELLDELRVLGCQRRVDLAQCCCTSTLSSSRNERGVCKVGGRGSVPASSTKQTNMKNATECFASIKPNLRKIWP